MSAGPPNTARGQGRYFEGGAKFWIRVLGPREFAWVCRGAWTHAWSLKSRPRKFSVAGMSSPPMAEENSSCQNILLDLREGCTSRT